MKLKPFASIGLGLIIALVLFLAVSAASVVETEPNNSAGQANALTRWDLMTGAISPSGDVDYFSVDGINTTWGFIALLETITSTTSTAGTLTALASDGVTILDADTGSWERGSGIALQNYADGSATHFLQVKENGDDETISSYNLRYYETITRTQPEKEPNGSRSNGTPSSFTMSGVISSANDVDCFAFQGTKGDDILLALKGDPENDGSPLDYELELISPGDVALISANFTGVGGNEFIDYTDLPVDGIYAYCVKAGSGTTGAAATYHAGIVRNGFLYFPGYSDNGIWLNPGPANGTFIGELLSFRLEVTNTGLLRIPGNIRIMASYDGTCASLVKANPPETSASSGYVSWDGQKDSLAPGEVYGVNLVLQAEAICNDLLDYDLGLDYFFTGTGENVKYNIFNGAFLPVVLTSTP